MRFIEQDIAIHAPIEELNGHHLHRAGPAAPAPSNFIRPTGGG